MWRLTWGVGASLGDLVQSILSTSATDAADSWNLVVSEDGINFLRPENQAIVGVGYTLTHVDAHPMLGLCRSELEQARVSPPTWAYVASAVKSPPSVRLGPRVPTERPLLVRFAKAGGIGKLIDALRNHADQIQASVARLYQTRCFHL